MRTDTWKWKDATITMRPEIGQDDYDSGAIAVAIARQIEKVPVPSLSNRVFGRYTDFAKIILQSTVEGDLGIGVAAPTFASTDEELATFYRTLALSPFHAELMSAWRDRVYRINQPPAPELHQDVSDPEPSSAVEKSSEISPKPHDGA